MRAVRTWCLGAALFALAPGASANEGTGDAPLTLDELLANVDRSFPLIAAAAREQEEASGSLLSAEGGFDPSVRGSFTVEPVSGYPKRYGGVTVEQPTPAWGTRLFAGYRYGTGKYPIYDRKIETNDGGELRGGVIVPLWRDGPIDRRRASIKQAELGVEVARLGVAQSRIEARRQATLRYWDWVAAGRRLAVLQSWLELARARDAGLAMRAERGDIPDVDRTENRRTILQRETAVAAAERDASTAAAELALFFRAADGTALSPPARRIPGEIAPAPVLDAETVRAGEERAVARRPEVKRNGLNQERSRIEAELARNQQKPGLDLTLFASKQFGPADTLRGDTVLGGALSIDLPVMTRVQTGREQTADATVAKLDEQTRFLRDRITADVRSALFAAEAARRRAEIAKAEVAVATELAQAELRKFELGDGNLLLVNIREQATAEAALRQIDALADGHKAIANYRAAAALDMPP